MAEASLRPEPVNRYNRTAIVLHWVVAVFIVVNVFVGLVGANTEDKSEARRLVDLHKAIGFTILGLVALRILWRLAHRPPRLPRVYTAFDRVCAHLAHACLYLVMLGLPLTGYVHDSAWKEAASHPLTFYGLFDIPRIGFIQALPFQTREQVHDVFGAAHQFAGYALYGLLALHLLGVAKHHALDGQRELQRMLPRTYEPET